MECDFFISIAELENILKKAKDKLKDESINSITFKVLATMSDERDYLTGGIALDREPSRKKDGK